MQGMNGMIGVHRLRCRDKGLGRNLATKSADKVRFHDRTNKDICIDAVQVQCFFDLRLHGHLRERNKLVYVQMYLQRPPSQRSVVVQGHE